jgi:hypothetical protein
LKSATGAENRSKEVDEKFKKAIDALSDFEKRCHSKETVAKRMAAADAHDLPSSTISKTKEKLKLRLRKGPEVSFASSGSSHINTDPLIPSHLRKSGR